MIRRLAIGAGVAALASAGFLGVAPAEASSTQASSAQATAVQSSSASRHYTIIYHGPVPGWVDMADVSASHRTIAVKDMECDGNGVWVEYYRKGIKRKLSFDDEGGCAGIAEDRTDRRKVRKYRLCEDTKGCTRYRYT